MYDLDHMMNGQRSREHHQRMITEAQLPRRNEQGNSDKPKRNSLPQRVKRIGIAIAQIFVK